MAARPPQKRRRTTATRRSQHPIANTVTWRKLAAAFLLAHPYCERCLLRGRKTVYKLQVDHILPVRQFPELALDPANLQTLDARCHAVKSGHERAGLAHDYRRQVTHRLRAA